MWKLASHKLFAHEVTLTVSAIRLVFMACSSHSFFAKRNNINTLWAQSLLRITDWIFLSWLPLPHTTITVIVPAISWMWMYSERCYMYSRCNHNCLTVFRVNQLTVNFTLLCFPLCYPLLPVLVGDPLIHFVCQSSLSGASHIWEIPLSLSHYLYVYHIRHHHQISRWKNKPP